MAASSLLVSRPAVSLVERWVTAGINGVENDGDGEHGL